MLNLVIRDQETVCSLKFFIGQQLLSPILSICIQFQKFSSGDKNRINAQGRNSLLEDEIIIQATINKQKKKIKFSVLSLCITSFPI